MRKFYSFLIAVLAVCGMANAQTTVTFDFTGDEAYKLFGFTGFSTGDSNVGDFTENASTTSDGVTITVSPSTTKTPNRMWSGSLRLYGGTLTVAAEGNNISAVKFALNSSKWGDGNTADSGELEKGSWTGNASQVVFTIAGNTQIKSIEVTLVSSDPNYVAAPAIKPATGTYYEAQEVTITAGEGTSIFYTLDGSDPTASSAAYTAPFTVETTTTVKAIAVKGENKSQVSESVITIETLEKKTIAEIIAAGAQDKVETSATVQAVYSAGLMLGDATGYITAYLGATPDVAVGDVVDVVGPTSAYGGCIQFGQGTEVTKTGTAEVVYPTAVELDGAAFDALVANPVITYVKVKGTLTISGNYKNLEIEGATNVGSIQCTSEVLGAVISGQEVEVTGFFAYKSGSSTVYGNIIATSITALGDVPTYATIAEVKAAAKADKVGVIFNAHEVLVTYINSNNVYIYDGTDGLMLYGKNSGFKAGDKISATVAGELYLYNGLTEISGCTFTDLAVVSSDNEVTPQKATIADVTNNYAQFESELVTIEGLTTDTIGWDENRLISFIDDIDNEIVVRDNFKVATNLAFDPQKTYTITGFVAAYTAEGTTSYRIYPRSAADIDNGDVPQPGPEPRETSLENPYSVTEVLAFEIAAKTDTIQVGAWVEGYIIGSVKNNKLNLGLEEAQASNIAIAVTADEQTVFLPVELASKSDARTVLNLVDNPAMLGKKVWLCGTITQYFGMNGLKALSDFSLDGQTRVSDLNTTVGTKVIYNLAGQRLQSLSRSGLYIIDGKKVVVK